MADQTERLTLHICNPCLYRIWREKKPLCTSGDGHVLSTRHPPLAQIKQEFWLSSEGCNSDNFWADQTETLTLHIYNPCLYRIWREKKPLKKKRPTMAMWCLQDTHPQGETDGRTDRQTDGRTDKSKPISLRFTGDNNTHYNKT